MPLNTEVAAEVPMPMSTGTPWPPRRSRSGVRDATPRRAANSGDSCRRRRIAKLASPVSPPMTKAMRQPVEAAASGVMRALMARLTRAARLTPELTKKNRTPQAKPPRAGAVSTA